MQKNSVILESHIGPSGARQLFLQVTKPYQNSNRTNYAPVTWSFICWPQRAWLELSVRQFDFIPFFSVFVSLSLILCGKFLIRAVFLWSLSIIHAWKVPTTISKMLDLSSMQFFPVLKIFDISEMYSKLELKENVKKVTKKRFGVFK